MSNNYLSFISDEHLFFSISELYTAYTRAKNNLSKQHFFSNKIDPIKLIFDASFNSADEEALLNAEVSRQIDKSINNAIGTFHENILGGIVGYEKGSLDGYDIKATDNSLFADIKNKHNTMNSSAAESLFQKLTRFAHKYPSSHCYWVQIWAKGSFKELWSNKINGIDYQHERIYKISGDRFYSLLTGIEDALFQLYNVLPVVIKEFLANIPIAATISEDSALSELKKDCQDSNRSLLDEIAYQNFSYYLGFDKLS